MVVGRRLQNQAAANESFFAKMLEGQGWADMLLRSLRPHASNGHLRSG